jgi:hypothetical protein
MELGNTAWTKGLIMASRKRTPAPVSLMDSLAPSEGLQSGGLSRGTKNPLSGAVAQSRDRALKLPAENGEAAKQITNWLRQDHTNDATMQDARLNVQYTDENGTRVRTERVTGEDGKVKTVFPDTIRFVHFMAESGKRQARSYTVADIRAWYTEQTGEELTGPVSAEIRQAFKEANGTQADANEDGSADA